MLSCVLAGGVRHLTGVSEQGGLQTDICSYAVSSELLFVSALHYITYGIL